MDQKRDIILGTGRRCTESGEWEVYGLLSTSVYLSKGDKMPQYCGKDVKWILIKKG